MNNTWLRTIFSLYEINSMEAKRKKPPLCSIQTKPKWIVHPTNDNIYLKYLDTFIF